MRFNSLILASSYLIACHFCQAFGESDHAESAPSEAAPLLRADVRLDKAIVQTGQPVWAEFSLTNLTDDAIVLRVPETPSNESAVPKEMGLPVAHVFSGKSFGALSIRDHRGDPFDTQVSVKPYEAVPVVRVAAHGSVGVRVELTHYYEALLRRPGRYTLTWNPYGGLLESEPVTVTLLSEQQAVILTDFGRLIIRFRYDAAPRHVQNFIELATQRFYDNLTFHRLVPGYIMQGGDPRGDGKGIRADGKRLQAEFSNIPFELGTVGMARSPRDPDSASCQFFICLSRQATFDGQQTAFGHVVGQESYDTLAKISALPTGPKDKPLKPVFIRAISLESIPREREAPGITISAGSRPASFQRELEPVRAGHEPEPTHHVAEPSPVQRLARLPRLLASTQPAAHK